MEPQTAKATITSKHSARGGEKGHVSVRSANVWAPTTCQVPFLQRGDHRWPSFQKKKKSSEKTKVYMSRPLYSEEFKLKFSGILEKEMPVALYKYNWINIAF